MPNWADENGKYWWKVEPPGLLGFIEIPHPPVSIRDGCKCDFCEYKKTKAKIESK